MVVVDKACDIDVLFILEGAYPYVKGGVSTCIQQLILGMPDISFGVIFLGSKPEDYQGIQYVLPKNLVYLENVFIFAPRKIFLSAWRGTGQGFHVLQQFLEEPKDFKPSPVLVDPEFYRTRATFVAFLYSRESWYSFFVELYRKGGFTMPFVDFFWSIRNIFFPLWPLADVASTLRKRKVRLIHSHSTGYAGLLGSFLKQIMGVPFVLTEHGIYVRERKAEILGSQWIRQKQPQDKYGIDELQTLWIRFFTNLGMLAYHWADRIYALYEGARSVQVHLGAPLAKTEVLPNGVDLPRFAQLQRLRKEEIPHVVAFIGRVVPIKDVKTFIKGIKVLTSRVPDVIGWIVGPEEEDPAYVEECRRLVRILQIEDRVRFLGFQDLEDIFPRVGLVALTSISEGMPMVLLEAFAAGVPCVAPDVGSCRQLICGGLNEEDRELGEAGRVIGVGDVHGFAEACADLLLNEAEWRRAQKAAIARIERFYTVERMVERYKAVYRTLG
ncbi:GT4 family glycosyltransferase PelF [Candidatus Caldatribacterium sp.]|uniref:GT4 family glycosyltransferase PelF n=1 Tax=Candidatus Caldatribacterium sp. TaxID=2282143 RepID=UPI00299912D2|nr:GT4 family glycosyltransferase PelF [Candidatus Caldatribacterium sp.]MDW8081107.1 GT4 family glycosyltransferase PelF [Candidatus Calescibacterium sp.]